MIISFSGHSGAGKTSIIDRVKKKGEFRGKKVFIGEEDRFLTVRVAKFLLGNKIFSGYKDERLRSKPVKSIKGKIFAFLAQFVYPAILYLDFLQEYLYYEKIYRNKILLRDKYIYDYLVTFEDILGIRNNIVKLLFINFPKPYLSFYVKIDAESAFKRNKNTREGRLEREISFHKRLIKSYDEVARTKKMIPVQGSKDLDAVALDIVRFIQLKDKLSKEKRIAIIGLDGSGKTTLARLFCKYIGQFDLDCKIVHFYHENLLYKTLLRLGVYGLGREDKAQYAKNRIYSKKHKNTP